MTDSTDDSNTENTAENEASNELNEEQGTQSAADQMAAMEAAMEQAGQHSSGADNTIEAEVTPARSAEEIARTVSGADVNIEALLKVPVSLSIEVGRTKMALNDLLDTQEGAVIELERLLDEPLDILVNGALIAHGVVVLAEDRFGIQVTDIISLEERARSL